MYACRTFSQIHQVRISGYRTSGHAKLSPVLAEEGVATEECLGNAAYDSLCSRLPPIALLSLGVPPRFATILEYDGEGKRVARVS